MLPFFWEGQSSHNADPTVNIPKFVTDQITTTQMLVFLQVPHKISL